jgi:hypothetical protein
MIRFFARGVKAELLPLVHKLFTVIGSLVGTTEWLQIISPQARPDSINYGVCED